MGSKHALQRCDQEDDREGCREIMAGNTTLKTKIEHGLRDSREMVEAVEAMLVEEVAST